jgi:tight adherence protein B
MDSMLLLIAIVVGASVATTFVYLFDRLTAPARSVRLRVAPPQRRSSAEAPLRRSGAGPLAPLVRVVPIGASARAGIRTDLIRAGQPFRFEEYIMLRVILGALGVAAALAVATQAVTLPQWATAGIAVAAGLLGWALPALLVARLRQRRLQLVEQQLPDALTVIAKAMRAGSGLMQALAFAAEEVDDPLGAELRATLRDLQLGADPEETFEALAERVGSQDLDITVTAIVIQRTVGGNLSEILTNVSETIRERAKLHAEVEVLTSRQRLTANLMAAMPVIVAVLFISLNPEMGRLLIDTVAGRIALAIGLGFELVGLVVIRRIAQIEV